MKSIFLTIIICMTVSFSYAKPPNTVCVNSTSDQFPEGDGTKEYPFVICNELQFQRLSKEDSLLSKSFQLGTDIDFKNETHPIGATLRYSGEFNGDGFTLSSIRLRGGAAGNPRTGVFGTIENALITNIHIDGITITNVKWQVGTIVGWAIKSLISNIHVKNIKMEAPSFSGGLIGVTQFSNVINCSSQGSMANASETESSGGLIGFANNTKIKNSFTDIIISNPHLQPAKIWLIGGLIGKMMNNSEVEDSFANGVIAYSNPEVGDKGPFWVGGLIGEVQDSKVSRSYATMILNIKAYMLGGAIGENRNGVVNNVYWDTEFADNYVSQGGVGLDTLTMKTPAFWLNEEFEPHLWILKPGQYPKLKESCK